MGGPFSWKHQLLYFSDMCFLWDKVSTINEVDLVPSACVCFPVLYMVPSQHVSKIFHLNIPKAPPHLQGPQNNDLLVR